MKKRPMMLVMMLALALVFGGIAYAAWTDQLFVNGTVNTGNLDVRYDSKLCCLDFFPFVLTSSCKVGAEASYSADLNSCTFTVNNLYPGAWAKIDIKQKNYGSIPAKFKAARLIIPNTPDNEALMPYINSKCHYTYEKNGKGLPEDEGWLQGSLCSFGKFDELDDCMTAKLEGKILEPGGWISFGGDENEDSLEPACIVLQLDKDALCNTTQGKELTFTLEMDWEQFNVR